MVSLPVVNVNAWSTFTLIVSVILQPNPSTNVNKYSVVTIGEANGLSMVGSLSSLVGVHDVTPIDEAPFN